MIKNIIFDLGGVLYEIDYEATEKAFASLSRAENIAQMRYSRSFQPEIITQYEIGKITESEFINGLRAEYQFTASDSEILAAWNAILVNIFPNREELVARFAQNYTIALLSNTNYSHITAITEETQNLFAPMKKTFFSHVLNDRKPNVSIFETVCKELDIPPEESLFIDDSPQHIEGARQAGLHTLWLKDPDSLEYALESILK